MKPVTTKVMVMVHGKSEFCLAKSIQSNLKIKQEIIAKDNGEHSIQITSIMARLQKKDLATFSGFVKHYSDVEYNRKEKKLINFKFFIIMDVDDCTEIQKKRYINKEMFASHWLRDYIVPIYNEPNLEKTMLSIGVKIEKKNNYIKIFPVNRGKLNKEEVERFSMAISNPKAKSCSNLYKYVKYCIDIVENK